MRKKLILAALAPVIFAVSAGNVGSDDALPPRLAA